MYTTLSINTSKILTFNLLFLYCLNLLATSIAMNFIALRENLTKLTYNITVNYKVFRFLSI